MRRIYSGDLTMDERRAHRDFLEEQERNSRNYRQDLDKRYLQKKIDLVADFVDSLYALPLIKEVDTSDVSFEYDDIYDDKTNIAIKYNDIPHIGKILGNFLAKRESYLAPIEVIHYNYSEPSGYEIIIPALKDVNYSTLEKSLNNMIDFLYRVGDAIGKQEKHMRDIGVINTSERFSRNSGQMYEKAIDYVETLVDAGYSFDSWDEIYEYAFDDTGDKGFAELVANQYADDYL